MKSIYKIPDNRIQVNCFGVDESFWTSTEQPGNDGFLLAVGNDSNRDYELLIQAAMGITQQIKLLTRRPLPARLPDNVVPVYGSWHSQALDDKGLRDLYRKAFGVVVPLKDSIQPSGQSVTLQAMACGTPVILTRTAGLWDKKGLQDRENVLFVEPGKADEIIAAVDLLGRDQTIRRAMCGAGLDYVLQHGRISQFAERMEAMCTKALSSGEGGGI